MIRIISIFPLYFVFLISVAYAQSSQVWEQVALRTKPQVVKGVGGGEGFQEILAMSYAKSNPSVAYFVVDVAQVYKTTNGGSTWARKTKGFLANGGSTVAVHPTNENVVLVAAGAMAQQNIGYSGVIRSANGGESWSRTYAADLLIPSGGARGGTLIAFTKDGSKVYAGFLKSGLIRSTDSGVTWVKVPKSSGGNVLEGIRIYDLKTHPSNNSTVLVAAADGLYRISNSEAVASVTKISTPEVPLILARHPTNENVFYFSNKSSIYKTTNGGSSFSKINGAIPASSEIIMGLAISPVDGNFLYVGAKPNSAYYSHDGGASWVFSANNDEKNSAGWVSRSVTENADGMENASYLGSVFAPHPSNKNIALTNGRDNRVKITADGGASYRYSATGWSGGRASAFAWADVKHPVFFLVDYGVYKSADGGNTFSFANHGRFDGARSAMSGAVSPNNPSYLVTAIGGWDFQTIGITEDGGTSWKLLTPATDGSYKYIAFHPQDSNIIYAGNKKIKRTSAGNYAVTNLSKSVMRVNPQNGNIVYAKGDLSGEIKTIIYKSTDGGLSWVDFATIPSYARDVLTMDVAPSNPNKLYVTAYYKGLYIIDNGTVTTKAFPADGHNMIATAVVAVDPNNPNIIYVGARHQWRGQSNGVFRTTDGGNTWSNITYNLGPELDVWVLTVNPHNSFIYLGTSNGTWRLPPLGSGDNTPPPAPQGLRLLP
ncbi:MAG: hypothetical protein IT291_10830 [Deltaproteobacteria bacterium]|nr:hypothetical protein [Deltaproteobacteria bacterium]